jgi:D-3-phosphoglycerate dehydrogenase
MSKADIVTLHVPETEQTKNLLNKSNLKYCKKGSIILNYARGEVIELNDLR